MHFRPTSFERHWVRILCSLALVVVGVLFLRPLLPASYAPQEPLADAESLKALVSGKVLPVPNFEKAAYFHDHETPALSQGQLSALLTPLSVLGDTTQEKRIEVDLSNQKTYAFEGDRLVYEFTVSTGKWARTPTGEFRIWAKVRSQKMSGGDKALGTYYYLPNVPYVMFFSNDQIAKMRGFSFHGTYWHENFGHPMSHGCVNMRTSDAQTLYEWANPIVTNQKAWSTLADASNNGTRVLIYGQTPME